MSDYFKAIGPKSLSLFQIKLSLPSMPSSESLLRTDSLSSTDPVLSDGSVGSAPSLGLSPGPTSALDMSTTDMTCGQEKMKQKEEEVKIGIFIGATKKYRMENISPAFNTLLLTKFLFTTFYSHPRKYR